MTTGIADFPATNWISYPPTITDIATFVGQLPRTNPGIWAYSDTSYNVLALICARILNPTGDPSAVFGQYFVDNIFIPAGMKTATAPSTVSEDNPDAQSHIYNDNGVIEEIGTNQYPDYTSMRVASITGSLEDFQSFVTALNNGQLITMDNLSMMLGQRLGGWDPGSTFVNGHSVLAKGGAQDGEQSFYMRFANNTAVFILANVGPKDYNNPFDHIQFLGSQIAQLLFPEP
jgi:CubicO group peptidase (beta-lactamase class C family)